MELIREMFGDRPVRQRKERIAAFLAAQSAALEASMIGVERVPEWADWYSRNLARARRMLRWRERHWIEVHEPVPWELECPEAFEKSMVGQFTLLGRALADLLVELPW